MTDNSAPEPEKKKKELKSCTFTREIGPNEEMEETPGKNDSKIAGNKLQLTLYLYDTEISLVAQRENINNKMPNILYEESISLETLQSLNKIFSILDLDKIFTIIQKSFEQKFDHISAQEDKLVIKMMINFMEVMTEEVTFELQMIKLTNEEETIIMKESIKLLNEEKQNLTNQVTLLQNSIEELKKTTSENKNDFENKLQEKEKNFENNLKEIKNTFQNNLQENKNDFDNKLQEIKNIFERKMEQMEVEKKEKEEERQKLFKKLEKEMLEVKEIEKYVRDKIIREELNEQEKDSYSLERKKTVNKNIYNMDISILLFENKIRIKIKEIQDNLKNNPTLYESDFVMEYFGGLSDYYKNQGGLKAIFDFLVKRFQDGEDTITKEDNKIIIKVIYTFGSSEDEIKFEIIKKELGLKNVLINFDESLKEINKVLINTKENLTETKENLTKTKENLINTKEEFKKNLLEKVYPIGSYYWSEKDTSPETLFGGKWRKIEGRFLFASNSNHYVGETGGEERHKLTIDEIPSHSHGYDRFCKDIICWKINGGGEHPYAPTEKDGNFWRSTTTNSTGGSNSHNNMPPYLTANCWKRVS